jgi:Holliday junction resolvasome RuvABC endonuclease subunit
MIITGIDLSFRHCGVASIVYERNENGLSLTIKRQEVIHTEYQGRDWWGLLKEIKQMRDLINELIDRCKDADYILVEIPTMGGKPAQQSVRTAGICYGILAGVEVALARKVRYVQPSELKLWSGKKTNKKEQVMEKVISRLGRTALSKDNNIIDALGLCLMRCDELSYEHHAANGISSDPIPKQIQSRGNHRSAGNIQQQIELLPSNSGRTES